MVDVFEILSGVNKVLVGFEWSQECQAIDAKRLGDFVQVLCAAILEFLRVDENKTVLVQFGTEHNLKCSQTHFSIAALSEVAKLWPVGPTAACAVRGSLIANTCHASAFLRSGLFAATSDVAFSLGYVRFANA